MGLEILTRVSVLFQNAIFENGILSSFGKLILIGLYAPVVIIFSGLTGLGIFTVTFLAGLSFLVCGLSVSLFKKVKGLPILATILLVLALILERLGPL